MLRKKGSITVVFLALLFLLLSITSCWLLTTPDPIVPDPIIGHAFRFSIKNASNSNIEVNLLVGKAPNIQARFDEFELIPEEIYTLLNEHWTTDLHAHCTIKPNSHNEMINFLPLTALGVQPDSIPIEYQEKYQILFENLSNKIISFILTISKNGTVIYRIVGWDLPEKDMEKYQVNDKLLGYYDTAQENYKDNYGNIQSYPLFYSKFITEETGKHFGGEFTFYIKSTSDNAFVQEFNLNSTRVDEDDYWGK